MLPFALVLWITASGYVSAAERTPVTVIEARLEPVVENLPLIGTITSERNAALSSRVSGLVEKVNVDAGDRVSKGDVLIQLDSTLAVLALHRAEAALNEVRSRFEEAKRLSQEANNLARGKNIPETTVMSRAADVNINKAIVARLEVEYRQQEEIVRRHTVFAPFDGSVSRKLTETGEWVETGTPVLELVATDQLRLDVQAPQEYFHILNENTEVIVKLDSYPEVNFKSKVVTTVPVNNPGSRTFLVRVQIDDADDYIIPGMSAQALFKIYMNQKAIVLPRDATVRHPDGRNSVWIVKEVDGELVASEQEVILGRGFSNSIIIKNGIAPGNRVVVRGNETLKEGQPVRILESTSTANK